MSDILVVKINMFTRAKEFQQIRDSIVAQKETGTIVLPPYCEALVVPEDTEIKIQDVKGEIYDSR